MHRFFVASGTLQEGASVELDLFAHQLHAVLRLRPGAQIVLLDGSGQQWAAEIIALDARRAVACVGAGRPCVSEPRLQIALYACSLKGEKFDWLLQKATELGVSRIVPVVSRRSIARPVAALERKYDRWRSVIREAAEQSGRGRLPVLAPALDFDEAVRSASGLRLLPWETALDVSLLPRLADSVSLLVGPEGGLEEGEVVLAQACGWQVVSLGPRILRAESASIAAIAAVLALAGDLGSFAAGTLRS